MQKWEYLFVYVFQGKVSSVNKKSTVNLGRDILDIVVSQKPPVEGFANQLGEEGWELVGTLSSDHPSTGQLIFKRPKP